MTLKSPYVYFGGKSKVAPLIWERFGEVRNYVEPFFGSGAVLLGRPTPFRGPETVNDKNGFISNFWRAVKAEPAKVAKWADWPAFENDHHARQAWLVGQKDSLQAKLEGDPDYFDCKIAGWWAWFMALTIGGSPCDGIGPWHVRDGELIREPDHDGPGIQRKIIRLYCPVGIRRTANPPDYLEQLAARFAKVRVSCGDWSRVCGYTPTTAQGLTAVFLDPPYSVEADRDMTLYGREESGDVAHAARKWAIEHGDDPLMRICLAGYDGEHKMPRGWRCFEWKANGGYANQGKNRGRENARRERLWFSPHCLGVAGSVATTKQRTFADVIA